MYISGAAVARKPGGGQDGRERERERSWVRAHKTCSVSCVGERERRSQRTHTETHTNSGSRVRGRRVVYDGTAYVGTYIVYIHIYIYIAF